MAAPSCRYVNLSHSPSDNRSNVDDGDTAAVHIQLRTDEADTAAADADVNTGTADEPHRTNASNDSQSALPQAPVCGGYIVVGPDTFGHFDATTGRFTNTDSGIERDHPLQRPHTDGGVGVTLASGQNRQNSDLTVPEDGCRQPGLEAAAVGDSLGVVQGNGNTDDSTPVTNYAMIVGMDDTELNDSERCLMDTYNVAERPDNDLMAGEELPPGRAVSDAEQQDDLAVPYEISNPPVCYSLNSGGYLSHSELLGAAPVL